MMTDIVDLVWLADAAISTGFLLCGGYLVIACFSVTEREEIAGIRLGRRQPSGSSLAANDSGSVELPRDDAGMGHRIASDQREAAASIGAVI